MSDAADSGTTAHARTEDARAGGEEPAPGDDSGGAGSDRIDHVGDGRDGHGGGVSGSRSDCPECGGDVVRDGQHPESVCVQCGLVVGSDRIDRGPEWRSFDDDGRQSKRRVGAPSTELRHDRGLSTKIGWEDRDSYGKQLPSNRRRKMNRLRSLNRKFRVRDSRDRNLRQALGEVDRMGCALGIPENVRETAAVIYRRSLEAGVVAGRSIEGVATACVYAAARQAGTPRSIDEVATVSRVDRRSFVRAYRHTVRELGLEVDLADPASYLRRYASEIDASSATERRALELLREGEDACVHVGKNPTGLAAAALYAGGLLTDGTATQSEICEVADISEVTIRNRYKELLEVADAD